MFNLIRADLFKMRKAVSTKILLCVTTVSAVTMTIMAYLITQGKINESMKGFNFLFSDANVMGILSAVIASIFICGDFENKTIQASISSGINRIKLIFSKAIVVFCGIGLLLVPYIIVTIVAIVSGASFHMGSIGVCYFNMILTDSAKILQSADIVRILIATITLLVVYVSQASICIPIALAVKKPIIVVVLFYVINISVGQLAPFAEKSDVFSTILSATPIDSKYLFISMDSSTGDIMKALAGSVIFIILMLLISYLIFRKAEIK
ncbi:MAG: hypothetical protein ACERKN_13415 [Velocimicrobium sp.]